MSHGHLFGYHMMREDREGVKGLKCDRCKHWQPLIARSDAELAERNVMAPAHERYVVSKTPSKKLIRFGRNK